MTDAEEADYFTDVLKRLDALGARPPKSNVLSEIVDDATESIGILVGYLLADSPNE